MNIELPNDIAVVVVKFLHAKLCIQIIRMLVKAPIIKNNCICIIFTIIRFIIEILTLAICYDRLSLAEVLRRHQMGCD